MQYNFLPVTFRGIAGAFVNGSLDVDEQGGPAVPRLNRRRASPWLKAFVTGHGHVYSPRIYTLCLIMHGTRFMHWQGNNCDWSLEEVRRPQDKLLCCWMTSISSPVTWNNERCWGGTNGHMRIYGGLLCLSCSNRVTGCATLSLLFCVRTCAHPF